MFGIGPTELLIIGVLFLVIFGPAKLPSMARDFGRFVNEARRSFDEFKSELISEDVKEVREGIKEARRNVRSTVNEVKSELTSDDSQPHRRRRDSGETRKKPTRASHAEEQTDAEAGDKKD